jgi:uncharacterized protein YegP (UPF0339 family)
VTLVVHVFPEVRRVFPGSRRAYYVRLVAANGETVAVSEAYSTRWSAMRAARKNFPGLSVKEMPQ